MDDFYAARSRTIPPLAWPNIAPPFSHAVDAALGLDTKSLVIVVGDTCPKFAREAEAEGHAGLLFNPEAGLGLAGSIAVGVRHAAETKCEKLLLMLGDMPFVTSSTLRRLADAATVGGLSATHYPGGKAGIPICVTDRHFDDMLSLTGDRGASSYLRGEPQCRKIDVPARELADIDTRMDLATLSIAPWH